MLTVVLERPCSGSMELTRLRGHRVVEGHAARPPVWA